jgi:hypothetical protein
MAVETGIEIFHYGFLRRREAYFEKSRALQEMFFGSYDDRLKKVERRDDWMETIPDVPWINQLIEFNGDHPGGVKSWLAERGYKL